MTQDTQTPLPESLESLTDEQKEAIEDYVTQRIDQAMVSVDRMLDASTHIITFLPSWIISKLTPKYVDPMLAARTTPKLTLKQAIKVSNALPVEYIGETANYLPLPLATEIHLGINEKHGIDLMKWLCENNTPLAITITEHIAQERKAKKILNAFSITEQQMESLSSEDHERAQAILS